MAAVKPRRSAGSPGLRKPLIVKYWMTSSVHSVGKEQPLSVAHRLMKEYDLRHLPVLEHGKLVGLVSERDLYYLESIAGVDVATERVEEGMTQEVFCTSPEARLHDAVLEMASQKYGCAVVMDGGKLVGIFTTTDALGLLATYLERS